MDASAHNNPDCFCCGERNPTSMGLRVTTAGTGELAGHARVDLRHEGGRGALHGGYVAAMFDEILGDLSTYLGTPGVTANLSVDFRAPIVLPADLTLRAWCAAREGRKMHMRAELRVDDRLAAEARGLWIVPRSEADRAAGPH